MKQEILVKVEHMNKRFGSTVALKDVSIEVCSGRVLGLIGENGSGKSTVTSIIAGMQNADSGTMTYHDKEWNVAGNGHGSRMLYRMRKRQEE